jgi:hypothetical protein
VPRFVAGKPPLGRLQDPTRCRKVESISQMRANYAATLTREVVMRNHPIVSQEAWLGMVLAMVVTILAITTGAAPPNCEDDSAVSIPPRETIYRPQHWNAY